MREFGTDKGRGSKYVFNGWSIEGAQSNSFHITDGAVNYLRLKIFDYDLSREAAGAFE